MYVCMYGGINGRLNNSLTDQCEMVRKGAWTFFKGFHDCRTKSPDVYILIITMARKGLLIRF